MIHDTLGYLPMSGPAPDTLVFARNLQDYQKWAATQGLARRFMNYGEYPDGSEVRWITAEEQLRGWDKVRIVYLPDWHEYFPGLMRAVHDTIQSLRVAGVIVSEERGTA